MRVSPVFLQLARALPAALLSLLVIPSAQASFLEGEALDTMANVVSWLVLILVPAGLIFLFWTVHVMPEKIAAKRQHPQKEAIHVLCLLSLAFGGLLWPIAWLWAYSRPVGYKAAFGTDKHEDYYIDKAADASRGEIPPDEIVLLLDELQQLRERGHLTPGLKRVQDRLAVASAQTAAAAPGRGAV